ncbi:MAG: hypothetical protein Q8L87_20765 [Anaerolineales bacterium]|nr:hypothetical protein [Anaerolineales bacterium]
MKNTKWIWWTLGILLVLVLIAGAGFTTYRMGYAQGAIAAQDGDLSQLFPRLHTRGFDGEGGRFHNFDRFEGKRSGGRGGFPFFVPILGLLRFVVLGGLIWLGYTLVRNNGWRLVKATPPAPVTPPSADGDEKNEAA